MYHGDSELPAFGPLDPLPSLSVRAEASSEEQIQYYSDLNRGYCDIDITRHPTDLEVNQDLWFGDDFAVTGGTINGMTALRDPNRHSRNDVVIIEALRSGFQRCQLTGHSRSDQVWIGTTNEEYADVIESSDFRTLYLPFDIIGYDPSRHQEDYDLELNSSVGKVISAALSDVVSRMPYTPSQEVPAMIGQVTDLVRDLVLGNRPHINRANINRARRLAMDAFIEDNLNGLTLRASKHLAQEFNVSRATLYRMFDPDGGVEAYVTRRRLHRTLISLKNAAPARGTIRKVAEGFGFEDAGNFSRAFQSEFGFRPSEIVGMRGADIGV